MSTQNTELISEYNFSANTITTVIESVSNWWNVCLANKRVSLEYTSSEWSTQTLDLSKKYLFNYYKRACVGESVGVVSFWTQFKQLVPVVSETYDTIIIHSFSECVNFNTTYNPVEHVQTFSSRLELNQ